MTAEQISELKSIVDASAATADVKLQAVTSAMTVAGSIALQQTKGEAGGQFLQLLLELFKILLPLLLDLLRPKQV